MLSKHRRTFNTVAGMSNFDTYKFITRLEADGFSREKAEAIMSSLTELVNERLALAYLLLVLILSYF